jgi:hypothetical protein
MCSGVLAHTHMNHRGRKAKMAAQLRSANLSYQRLANFQVKIGADYQCPACWIEHEARSALRPIGSGTDTEDIFPLL